MKKIILTFICSLFSFSVFAQTDLMSYIYGKAMVGDVEGLRSLMAQGYSLEEKDRDGNTVYCLAIFRRNQTAIKTLEAVGVNTRPRCMKNVPIVTEKMIYEAAHNKNTDQIAVWQEYGVPVDLIDPATENTALCHAVYEKDCDAIDTLLRAGASEYHTCMRRVPQKVRQELDCKPLVIDWERVGLTALGVGLVGGGVAVLLSGGGSSGNSCPEGTHWDGKNCVRCEEGFCWSGTVCRSVFPGEYIDPITNQCRQIAPPPYTDGTYSPSSFETKEYLAGKFLTPIKASSAYAHGYTGYFIDRIEQNNFGELTNGQVSQPGTSQDILTTRPRIAVLSSGTEITNTTSTDSTTGTTTIDRYVNKDLAYEVEVVENENGTKTETPKEGTGVWRGNLAINKNEKLFGYNFDYGYDSRLNQTNKDVEDETSIYDKMASLGINKTTYYATGRIQYFIPDSEDTDTTEYLVLHGGDCLSTSGFCGVTPTWDIVDLTDCALNGCVGISSDSYLSNVTYDTDYDYNESDPNPHYKFKSSPTRSREQGTMLAGIIAALKNDIGMHGVAYNAEVLPVISDLVRPITDTMIKKFISNTDIVLQDYAIESIEGDETTVAGFALNKPIEEVYGSSAATAYHLVALNDAIFVVGTGTSGSNTVENGVVTIGTEIQQKDATLSAGVPLTHISDTNTGSPDIANYFLSATAVQADSNAINGYVLTSYAQPCGSTARYCLSAPGGTGVMGDKGDKGNLYSTVTTNQDEIDYNYAEDFGTSAAAAVVAGAAAVLKGAYPHLSSREIVTLLEKTATPLGACSVSGATEGTTLGSDVCHAANDGITDGNQYYSKLYGWGLVNLEKATKPVGTLWVHDGDSVSTESYNTYTVSNSKLMSAPMISKNFLNALPSSFTAFDSYNRPFAVNTKSLLSVHTARKEFDDDFKAFMHGRDVMRLEPNDQFTMSYAPRTSNRSSQMKTGLMEVAMDFGKTNLGFYYTEDTLNSRGNYFERPLNNPFVQIQEAYGAEAKYNLTSKLTLGMGYATGKNGFLGDGDKDFDAPENRVSMVSTEAVYKATKSVVFKASYGVMEEQDSVLGMMGSGAFKMNGASTTFVSAGVEIKPTDKFKLNLAYTYGWTRPEQSSGLMSLSRLTADGFAAVAQYHLNSDNMLGVSVSSPLKIRSGKVAFDLPVGRSDTDDTIYRETFTGSMKPTARELDFALFYRDAVTKALNIQTELGLRLHPDHQRNADPDYRAMVGLKWDY